MKLVRIFAIPAVLGVLTAAGLISALLGDGVFDVIAWVCVGAPIATIVASILGGARGR